MKTYEYFSEVYSRQVQATYNAKGVLTSFVVIDGHDVEQPKLADGVLKNMAHEQPFLDRARQVGLKLIAVDRVVTFDEFWNRYKQKDCGRKKAEEAWNRLSKANQIAAYDFIPAFEGILKLSNTPKPYATTYLNQTRWDR